MALIPGPLGNSLLDPSENSRVLDQALSLFPRPVSTVAITRGVRKEIPDAPEFGAHVHGEWNDRSHGEFHRQLKANGVKDCPDNSGGDLLNCNCNCINVEISG